ncbi:tuberous sclerosis 1 [Diplocarpon rosae]|nr:tuberous sclerosis 1 [Diplocarpon rosae]
MASGSLKDLCKSITIAVPNLVLPLPDDLSHVIDAYLEKHAVYDDTDCQRLQEELLSIYQSSILDHPMHLAPFLSILRTLKPNIKGSGRLLQWWETLSGPIIVYLGTERGLWFEARDTILQLLIYDEEDEMFLQDAKTTSEAVADNLMGIWIAKSKLALEEFNEHAKFLEAQIQLILLSFGKRRPQDLLITIDKYFVKKDSRIQALSLLCEFFRHQPPHLHQMMQTPLFDNLLRCLQTDTSTRVISLAMTAIIMFLPHIPIASSKYLPALFNIYSRMLFWEKERRIIDPVLQKTAGGEDIDEESSKEDGKQWQKLAYLLDSEDENVPELLHYFTFLYGLYPLNFMSYIRKPQRYLRHSKFFGADDLDIEPMQIRQRSEPFRQVHLMHPNFFTLTLESELTDTDRWQRSSAADVVAECMALYVPSEDGQEHIPRPRGQLKHIEMNSDVPDQPLLDSDPVSYLARHASWWDTRSTMVTSPDGYRLMPGPGPHCRPSQTSQLLPSAAVSPAPLYSECQDSPTIPPQQIGSPSKNLSDIHNSQDSGRRSLFQDTTNDSVGSLPTTNSNETSQVNAFLDSLTRESTPRSPSLQPSTAATGLKTAYLQREIQLLKNDLNFERYLKQQHLSHIGKIRRQQIREARMEAETQHLMNYNRGLKAKLTEAKRVNTQMKKETEKSKAYARKWEADITAKLRVLRDEQRKWNLEREKLVGDLAISRDANNKLKNIILETERYATEADQTVKSIKSNLDELERLRKENERMSRKILILEAGDRDREQAKEREEAALNQAHFFEMELETRNTELAKFQAAFDSELVNVCNQDNSSSFRNNNPEKECFSQAFIDTTMAASRHRINELMLSSKHLLKRYNRLLASYTELQEHVNGQEPLGSRSLSIAKSSPSQHGSRSKTCSSSCCCIEQLLPSDAGNAGFPARPACLNTSNTSYLSRQSQVDNHSLVLASGHQLQQFQSSLSTNMPSIIRTRKSSESIGGNSFGTIALPRNKQQSDMRTFSYSKSSLTLYYSINFNL